MATSPRESVFEDEKQAGDYIPDQVLAPNPTASPTIRPCQEGLDVKPSSERIVTAAKDQTTARSALRMIR